MRRWWLNDRVIGETQWPPGGKEGLLQGLWALPSRGLILVPYRFASGEPYPTDKHLPGRYCRAMVVDQFQRPLRDLRISVTDKCNFRCPYCMPADVFGDDYKFSPKANVLNFEEVTRLVKLFAKAGTKKIRLTGGEPLLRKGLEVLVEELHGVEGIEDITLTTNGWLFQQHGEKLVKAGVNRITFSLDSLDDEIFKKMNGRGYSVQKVLDSISFARELGLNPIKINAVVKRGANDGQILPLARFAREQGLVLRYIEYMDVGNRNGWRMDDVVPADEILNAINAEMPLEPEKPNYFGEVARRYRYKDGSGEVGVIASITKPFCGDCTRARLSTDGRIVTCLFAQDGLNLREPMRAGATDDELFGLLTDYWGNRKDRYSELRAEGGTGDQEKIEMYQIGG